MSRIRVPLLFLACLMILPLVADASCRDCDTDFLCSSPPQGSPGFEECEVQERRNCEEGSACAGYRFCIARQVCGSQPFRVVEVEIPTAARKAVAQDFPNLDRLLSLVLTTGEFRGVLAVESTDRASETLRFEGWLQRALGNVLTVAFDDHPTLTALTVEWSGDEWEVVVLADRPWVYSSQDG